MADTGLLINKALLNTLKASVGAGCVVVTAVVSVVGRVVGNVVGTVVGIVVGTVVGCVVVGNVVVVSSISVLPQAAKQNKRESVKIKANTFFDFINLSSLIKDIFSAADFVFGIFPMNCCSRIARDFNGKTVTVLLYGYFTFFAYEGAFE